VTRNKITGRPPTQIYVYAMRNARCDRWKTYALFKRAHYRPTGPRTPKVLAPSRGMGPLKDRLTRASISTCAEPLVIVSHHRFK
jgi:hypothetical protein